MTWSFNSSLQLSYLWNGGSFTASSMVMQVSSGVLIIMFIWILSFENFNNMNVELFGYDVIRYWHANICSIVFIGMVLHVSRSIFNGFYVQVNTWKSGFGILLLSMGSAFLGYVLPWGQMSLWGATVITSLASVIGDICTLIWSGSVVGVPTLGRFISLHYLLPLIVMALIGVHLFILHIDVSSGNASTLNFSESFLGNDMVTVSFGVSFVGLLISTLVFYFIDADNWVKSNNIVTPLHINPEWYFLFAYSILRCIPHKPSGVALLVGSLIILIVWTVYITSLNVVGAWFILTFLGGSLMETYFINWSQLLTVVYFV